MSTIIVALNEPLSLYLQTFQNWTQSDVAGVTPTCLVLVVGGNNLFCGEKSRSFAYHVCGHEFIFHIEKDFSSWKSRDVHEKSPLMCCLSDMRNIGLEWRLLTDWKVTLVGISCIFLKCAYVKWLFWKWNKLLTFEKGINVRLFNAEKTVHKLNIRDSKDKIQSIYNLCCLLNLLRYTLLILLMTFSVLLLLCFYSLFLAQTFGYRRMNVRSLGRRFNCVVWYSGTRLDFNVTFV